MMQWWSLTPTLKPLDTLFLAYLAERYQLQSVDQALWAIAYAYVRGDSRITIDELRAYIVRVPALRENPDAAKDAVKGLRRLEALQDGGNTEEGATDLRFKARYRDWYSPRFIYRVGPTELLIFHYIAAFYGRPVDYAIRRAVRTYMLVDKRIKIEKFKEYVDKRIEEDTPRAVKDEVTSAMEELVVGRQTIVEQKRKSGRPVA